VIEASLAGPTPDMDAGRLEKIIIEQQVEVNCLRARVRQLEQSLAQQREAPEKSTSRWRYWLSYKEYI